MSLADRRFVLWRDVGVVGLSILLAIILVQTKALDALAEASTWSIEITALVAGIFFSSVFTTVPAMVTLVILAEHNPPLIVALFGAVGSACGDFVLFGFVKNVVLEDFKMLLSSQRRARLAHLAHLKAVRFLMPLIGAIIIASPLPDELGIAILGLSKIPHKWFFFLSFALNFVGILVISAVGHQLS